MQPQTANKALIVIVTYNRADVTCLMLESLFEVKNETPFEIIVIDNLSQKNEHDQMKETFDRLLIQHHANGKFISNQKNTGYSAGNNIGIQYAFDHANSFTHLCLLNNDTIVSDHWLDRLVQHAENLGGLIGPVTNTVGNEQLVPADYDPQAGLEKVKQSVYAYAKRWYESHAGNVASTWMLGFFCVFGKTSVFQQIGLLDENFGIGTYEDDDYCHRARVLKIKLSIARDVFIHHWGSASFSKLKQNFFAELMERNRRYYESKNKHPWKNPATTTFECYRNEVLWSQNHRHPLIDQALEMYENRLKYQVSAGQALWTQFRLEPLWSTLQHWASSNITSSKTKRITVLLCAYLFSLGSKSKKNKNQFEYTCQLIRGVRNEK